jgi:integrase
MSNRRQFGSVRKMGSGKWQAAYWHRGRRHVAPITFKFKADASAYLSKVETELRRGVWIDPNGSRILFREWVEEWSETIVDLRPSSRVRDLGYLRRYLLPRFGELELGEIDHMLVRAWVAELNALGLAPSTTTKAAQLMGKIMRSAVQAGLLPVSPCEGVRLPRIEHKEMRFLTAGDVDGLAAAIHPRYRAAVLLAAYGGLRAGELFGLRAKRVDLLRRRVQIAETVVDVGGHLHFGPPKTRAGNRTVPLPRVAAEPLGEHLATFARRPEDLVFSAPEGRAGAAQRVATPFLGARPEISRTRSSAPARSAPHGGRPVDRRRCQPQGGRRAGRTHVRELHARPLRTSVPRLGGRPQRLAGRPRAERTAGRWRHRPRAIARGGGRSVTEEGGGGRSLRAHGAREGLTHSTIVGSRNALTRVNRVGARGLEPPTSAV